MIRQCLKPIIVLGKGIRHLACGGADLGGRLNAQVDEHVSKLGVRHQRVFVSIRCSNQRFLLVHHIDQVLLKQGQVQLQCWLGEHAQSQIDEAQLLVLETGAQNLKELIRNLYVILAILTVLLQVRRCEVTATLTHCRHDLSTLLAHAIPLSGFCQTVANLSTINCTEHGQRIHECKRMDIEIPSQYCTIEHHVVGYDKVLLHLKMVKPIFGFALCTAEPHGSPITNFDRYTDNLKAIVTDVFFCG